DRSGTDRLVRVLDAVAVVVRQPGIDSERRRDAHTDQDIVLQPPAFNVRVCDPIARAREVSAVPIVAGAVAQVHPRAQRARIAIAGQPPARKMVLSEALRELRHAAEETLIS